MIASLAHLKWGLYRLFIDAPLYFGNVRTAFRKLRDLSIPEIADSFSCERFDTEAIKRRGPSLPLKPIAKDSRYLISEMACKSYGDSAGTDGDLRTVLLEAYKAHAAAGNPSNVPIESPTLLLVASTLKPPFQAISKLGEAQNWLWRLNKSRQEAGGILLVRDTISSFRAL